MAIARIASRAHRRYTGRMRMILTGTGTSHGVPAISCRCSVCTSCDPKDKRFRCSAYIAHKSDSGRETHIVIDTGPEFRMQALAHHIDSLDAVLLTHAHADHIAGLDDLRIYSHTKSEGALKGTHRPETDESPGNGLPVYADDRTLLGIQKRFDYIFKPTQIGGGKPKLRLVNASRFSGNDPLRIGAVRAIPIPMFHGDLQTTGWLLSVEGVDSVRSIAYLTDCSRIPESSIETLISYGGTIEHAVIDGLREKPHATHFSYFEAMKTASRIRPRRIWLTHMSHDMSHADITRYCIRKVKDVPVLSEIVKEGGSVLPAYDGLALDL